MAATVKPSSPSLQTGLGLYTGLQNYWLFQGDGTDLKGNNNFTVSDPGADTITWPTVGDDGQLVDRDADANSDRLTLSGMTSVGTEFSVAGRIYVRSMTGYGTIIGDVTTSEGLYAVSVAADFRFEYYNALSTITYAVNNWYSFAFTYDNADITKWRWFVNGVAGTTGVNTVADVAYDHSLSDASNNELDCRIAWLGRWNRQLTADEITSLHTDPYLLVTAAGGGGAGGRAGGAGKKGGGSRVGKNDLYPGGAQYQRRGGF